MIHQFKVTKFKLYVNNIEIKIVVEINNKKENYEKEEIEKITNYSRNYREKDRQQNYSYEYEYVYVYIYIYNI